MPGTQWVLNKYRLKETLKRGDVRWKRVVCEHTNMKKNAIFLKEQHETLYSQKKGDREE